MRTARRPWAIPPEVDGGGRFVIPAREFAPAYLETRESGRLREKVEEALEALRACRLCPRDCGIDRLGGRFAVCKSARYARVSSYFPHFGEEDVLRGWLGSGTIFFAWCNLRCVFCLRGDVRVMTDHGLRKIDEIFAAADTEVAVDGGTVRLVKDVRIWTREGRPAPVAKAFSHPYRGQMLVIEPSGLPGLVVTLDHGVFAAAAPDAEIRKVRAAELTPSHWLVVPKPHEEQPPAPGLPRRRRLDRGRCFLVPIRKIASVPHDGPVYNLEVDDPDHSYVAAGVAVANCQNFETSQQGEGVEVGPRELAAMMLELQARGCHNINFVTPEHVVPQILEALPYAIERGLRLPIVYNTSAYDSLHSIRLMEGVVDVYMPDFKLWEREHARRYLLAPDYPEAARRVIRAMHEQVGELRVNEDGLAVRGLLVRHLVMPGLLADTGEIMRWTAALSPDTYVNVMDQYYPAWKAKTDEKYREINRGVEEAEMETAYACARQAGLWRFDRRWRASVDRLWARLAGG